MRRAFTLVEVLIAVALGAVIAAVAGSALRLAAAAVVTAGRLGLENALIRTGIASALDEVDGWRTYDDPDASPPVDRLRATADGYGQPFTPFASGWPSDVPQRWDGDGARWAPNSPDAWWRGNLTERPTTDLRYGRYALLANVRAPALVGSRDCGVYGSVPEVRTWLADQVRGLDHALGFYGLLEYLPPSQVLAWYDSAPDAREPTLQGGMCAYWPTANAWAKQPCFDPYASRAVVAPTATTSGWSAAELVAAQRAMYQTGWMSSFLPGEMDGFLARSLSDQRLCPVAPAQWPEVHVRVCRSVRLWRFNTLCRVRWMSPLTGEGTDLSFSAFGTTLRGARQARGLDAP